MTHYTVDGWRVKQCEVKSSVARSPRMSLSLFANMEGLEGGAEGGGGGRGLGRRGESRSQSNCPTLDNRRRSSAANERRRRPRRLRLSSGTAAAAVACLLVVLLSSPTTVSAANMMAENLREKMHTDYLSGDAGEHSAQVTLEIARVSRL